ncbi:MAG: hypothetical protein LIO81_11415 [Clostridiales bacterium]|nr:hypothetical protein [Clostridiales bacterium]
MRYQCFVTAALTFCLSFQLMSTAQVMTVQAATVTAGLTRGEGGSSESGPGVVGPGSVTTAWTFSNGQYRDTEGNAITGALARGVSVSKWQGDIDWRRVAADDISFAMIRMVSYGYEGEITMDEYFDANMRGAAAAGIRTASYVYLQTKTVEEARAAAQFAVDTASGYTVNYPIAVDIESSYILELSTQELTDVVNAFCEVITANGYTPLVYSDYWKFTNELDVSQIPYDLWLARYGTSDSTFPGRAIWQPTAEGKVDGITGNVCLEFAFKDYSF